MEKVKKLIEQEKTEAQATLEETEVWSPGRREGFPHQAMQMICTPVLTAQAHHDTYSSDYCMGAPCPMLSVITLGNFYLILRRRRLRPREQDSH
jgi:hypothetical protein